MAPSNPLEKKPSRLGLRSTRSKANFIDQAPPIPSPANPALVPMATAMIGSAGRSGLDNASTLRSEGNSGTPAVPSVPGFYTSFPQTPGRRVLSSASTASTDPARIGARNGALKSYLRIRPSLAIDETDWGRSEPYLEMVGDAQVLMKQPIDASRPNALPKAPQLYSFDQVFPPSTSQPDFFRQTTRPLVADVLKGKSGLIFAYGVSNSGKTYTIQGGDEDGGKVEDRGLVPRSIDAIFESIVEAEFQGCLKAIRQQSVEILVDPAQECCIAAPAKPKFTRNGDPLDIVPDAEYAVFISYAEVYNEKIFDLLESVQLSTDTMRSDDAVIPSMPPPTPRRPQHRSISKAFGIFGSRPSIAPQANANGGTGILRRQALSLKADPDGGKYIAGLKQVRVRTREDAHALFKMGQVDRQVFGTCLNQYSSRSHGIFTIKVVRLPKGSQDASVAKVSRLSIVDLAGSERNKNSQTTDEHLREAANINTSLMTLGLCLETLRANQVLTANPANIGRRKPALVPYNHSKLTQIFQNFFVGNGQAAMVVHINPYDTGFEENSHVMRFSAIAREVQAGTAAKTGHTFGKGFDAFKQAMRSTVSLPVPILEERTRAQVGGFVDQEFEIEEVEAEEDDSDEGTDGMVLALIDEMRALRVQLAQAEMRNSTLEAEIRQEVVGEMNQQIKRLQQMHERRLMEEIEAHEELTDRKIDILQRNLTAKALRTPNKSVHTDFSTGPIDQSPIRDASDDEEVPSFVGGVQANAEEREIEASLFLDDSVSTDSSPSAGRHLDLHNPTAFTGARPYLSHVELSREARSPPPDGTWKAGTNLSQGRASELQREGVEGSRRGSDDLQLASAVFSRNRADGPQDGRSDNPTCPEQLLDGRCRSSDDTAEAEDNSEDADSENESEEDSGLPEDKANLDGDDGAGYDSSITEASISSQSSIPVKKSPVKRRTSTVITRNKGAATAAPEPIPRSGQIRTRAARRITERPEVIALMDSSEDDLISDRKGRAADALAGTDYVPAPDEKDAAVKKRKRKLGKAVVQEEEMMRDTSKASSSVQIKRRL